MRPQHIDFFLRRRITEVNIVSLLKKHHYSAVCMCSLLRPDFVPSDDKGHLAAPRVDETGPAGVQGDVVSILTAKTHW